MFIDSSKEDFTNNETTSFVRRVKKNSSEERFEKIWEIWGRLKKKDLGLDDFEKIWELIFITFGRYGVDA